MDEGEGMTIEIIQPPIECVVLKLTTEEAAILLKVCGYITGTGAIRPVTDAIHELLSELTLPPCRGVVQQDMVVDHL